MFGSCCRPAPQNGEGSLLLLHAPLTGAREVVDALQNLRPEVRHLNTAATYGLNSNVPLASSHPQPGQRARYWAGAAADMARLGLTPILEARDSDLSAHQMLRGINRPTTTVMLHTPLQKIAQTNEGNAGVQALLQFAKVHAGQQQGGNMALEYVRPRDINRAVAAVTAQLPSYDRESTGSMLTRSLHSALGMNSDSKGAYVVPKGRVDLALNVNALGPKPAAKRILAALSEAESTYRPSALFGTNMGEAGIEHELVQPKDIVKYTYRNNGVDWPCETCGPENNKQQSPINVETEQAAACAWKFDVTIQRPASSKLVLSNSGQSVELAVNSPAFFKCDHYMAAHLRLSSPGAIFRKMVFHVPAEHSFDGTFADGEVQFFYEKQAEPGQFVAVSVPIRKGSCEESTTPFLKPIADALRTQSCPCNAATFQPWAVPLAGYFPKLSTDYFRQVYMYPGSRTAPPCNQNVTWVLSQKEMVLTENDYNNLHRQLTYVENAGAPNKRPVQPLNDRKVYTQVEEPVRDPCEEDDKPQPWNYAANSKDWDAGACRFGAFQSPIDLRSKDALTVPCGARQVEIAGLGTVGGVEMYNSGKALVLTMNQETSLTVPKLGLEQQAMKLERIVFHARSEHTFDGKDRDGEMQFVFNANPTGLNGPAQFVVFAVPLDSLPCSDTDAFLKPVTSKLNDMVDSGARTGLFAFNSTLPPEYFQSVYMYPGSATAPPCAENVTWIVSNQAMQISESDFSRLHLALSYDENKNCKGEVQPNRRPTQPQNGRVVYRT